MGLIANVFIAAVVIVVILVAIRYLSTGVHSTLSESQAVAEIITFIKSSFPNSVVNITTNVTSPRRIREAGRYRRRR